jgi:4-methyl-5(b-hydroxyethyl)-thiazole monophosphate biosynthesis
MAKKIVLLLADGFEDVEAVTPIDYLRRAGVEVTVASVGGTRTVKSSRSLTVQADTTLAELAREGKLRSDQWDGVIIPGGMPGATNVAASVTAATLIKDLAAAKKMIGAICAAPAVVLGPLGVLAGRRFTCYPGMEKDVSGAYWAGEKDRVVVDGTLITSRGPGTAGEWAKEMITRLVDTAMAEKIAQATLLR